MTVVCACAASRGRAEGQLLIPEGTQPWARRPLRRWPPPDEPADAGVEVL